MNQGNNPLLDALKGKKTSVTPVWYMRQAGRVFPEYRKLREKYGIITLATTPELASRITLLPVDVLGVDAAILFADIMLPLKSSGIGLKIIEGVGPVLDKPIRTLKDINLLGQLHPDEEMTFISETIKIVKGKLSGKVPLIGFSGAPFTLAGYLIEGKPSRDFVRTKIFMYTQKEAWASLMDKLTGIVISYLRFQVASGADILQLFDSWVGCLSSDDYQTYVYPYSKKIFSALSGNGVPLIHFGTGNAAFLKTFAAVDCDAVGIDWRIPLNIAWKQIGYNKSIQGNLDPAVLVAGFKETKGSVDKIFSSLPKRTGYVFNLGHGVLPETPLKNLILLTDYVHGK